MKNRSLFTKKIAGTFLFLSLAAGTFSQSKYSSAEVNSFDRLIMNPYSKTLDYLGTGFEAATLLASAVFIYFIISDTLKMKILSLVISPTEVPYSGFSSGITSVSQMLFFSSSLKALE